MTSAINTDTLNISYPVAGVNNNSQGFRDNFTNIKKNLTITASEISELQSSSIFKSAISGTVLDNDMNNNILKRAQTLSFVSSTYNLGSNLNGDVVVDISLGDVQYGAVSGDILLSFLKWGPDKTKSSVEVVLTVNAGIKITLPSTVSLGTSTIENFQSSIITVPDGVTQLHFRFTSLDCGMTVEIESIDRPRRCTQLASTTVPVSSTSSGFTGQISYDSNYIYVCVGNNMWQRIAYDTSAW